MDKGRPTIYSKELVTNICEQIADGTSLRRICDKPEMPARKTVHLWLLDKEKKDFLHQYEAACNVRAENMFDNLNEIADVSDDSESPARSRLRVDTRKWYLSKVLPKKFGDKMDLTSDGKALPQPLLANLAENVSNNSGNKEDSSTESKD